MTILHFDKTTLGSTTVGIAHILLLAWDGAKFTFGIDGNTVLFDPSGLASISEPLPHNPFRDLQTQVLGPIDGTRPEFFLDPEQGGSITATFDNVLVNNSPLSGKLSIKISYPFLAPV